ncbi:MAG: hypothetical protein LBC74_02245 [Planctomycetaceae bacterium]|jgi:hypothetical protein|nr:hypothetical protein [Planctomycetaceae bacterium]
MLIDSHKSIDSHGLVGNNIFKFPEYLDITGNWQHCIEETEKDGVMNLTIIVSNSFPRIDLPRQGIFFLKNQKCADAVIWEHLDAKRYRLHLFEMKRTIKPSKWEEVKDQFNGAYLCCRLIAGLLDWEIDNCTVLYSVFHKDLFQNPPVENTDPILERVPTDSNKVQEEIEWNQCNIIINGLPPHFGDLIFRHKKIKLEKSDSNAIPSGEISL